MPLTELLMLEAVDAAADADQADSREHRQDALLRLPVIYRSAVVLHDGEGLTMSGRRDPDDVIPARILERTHAAGR